MTDEHDGLICAGVRMKYWFSEDMTGEDSVAGWRDRALGPFERHDSGMHFLRRYGIRYDLASSTHTSTASPQSGGKPLQHVLLETGVALL